MERVGQTGLIGREAALKRVQAVISQTGQAKHSALFVSGAAGIGKSSLIRASLANSDSARGWGTCWHSDGAPGFWPWMQALDELVGNIGGKLAAQVAGEDKERLSVLVRSFAASERSPSQPDQDRLLLFDAVGRWLAKLSERAQVVLVLDDLQWADSSSLEMLEHVSAATFAANLLLIGAYRPSDLDDDALASISRIAKGADTIFLEGLSVEEVAELIARTRGRAASPGEAARLHHRTDGHPLFVGEIARLPDLGLSGILPAAVTGAVAQRLEALMPETRHLLDIASVLGNRLLPDVVAAVSERTTADMYRDLSPAQSAGLITRSETHDWRFTHDVFRETLYARIETAALSELHGKIGDALQARAKRGAEVAASDMAYHFAQAARTGAPANAIHWARLAAVEDHGRAAFSEAAGHLRRVRRATVEAGHDLDSALLVELLIDEADCEARSGNPETARRLLLRAFELSPDALWSADIALAVQRLGAKFSAPRDETIALLRSALGQVSDTDVSRQAQVAAALSRELQHSVVRDRESAVALSEEALALGRKSDDDKTLIACLLARHDGLWTPGTGTERAALGAEIALAGTRLGDTDRISEGLLLEANGLLESGSARFRTTIRQWINILEVRNEVRDQYMVESRRAALALLDGDAELAEFRMQGAAQIGERIREPDVGNVLMSQRVALARVRNLEVEYVALAEDAVSWWTGAPLLAHAVAAGALASSGDIDGAANEVKKVAALGGWKAEGSYLRSVLVAHLAEAAVAVGDDGLCQELFDDVIPLVGNCGVNGAFVAFAGPFAHTAGILANALGDEAAASVFFQQSIDVSTQLGAVTWERLGEKARSALAAEKELANRDAAIADWSEEASLVRVGNVWTITYGNESGHVAHVKGLIDLATLVQRPGRDVSALELAGGLMVSGGRERVLDVEALDAYRTRLDDLVTDIDRSVAESDIGRVALLEEEREILLLEIRRATGLRGRIRTNANDPAERARKAVSARVRDAIRRIEGVSPLLAAHLDRTIQTGLNCSYVPANDDRSLEWMILQSGAPKS